MSLDARIAALPPEKRKLFEALAAREREKKRRASQGPQPIVRRPAAPDCPLSFDQERLWFIHHLEPGSTAYNIDAAMRLSGRLDVRAFRRAVAEIVRRHQVWRTTFPMRQGRPVQVIHPPWRPPVPVIDLTGVEALDDGELGRLALAEAHRPFDLEAGPLVRLTLVRLGDREHLLLLAVHHIVTDWFSFHLFWAELARLYPAYAEGRRPELPELPVQYSDFVLWQRERFSGETLERYLDFWVQELAEFPQVLKLPTDHPRPNRYTSRGRKRPVVVERHRTQALKSLGGREGASLYLTVLALYSTLLMRYSGQERLLIGSPNANRGARELESVIGFFLTQLVYACDLTGEPSFRELLRRLRAWSLRALRHADLPFGKLVEVLQPARDPSRPPLVQTNLLLLDAEYSHLALPGLAIEPLLIDDQAARYELSMAIWDAGEGMLKGHLEYNLALFDLTTVQRLVECLHSLIDGVVAEPDRPLTRVPLLPPAMRHQVLAEEDGLRVPLPPEPWVQRRVAARTAEAPDAVAVEGGDELLSYGELTRRSAAGAARLLRDGVGPEEVIGVWCHRSPAMVVGIFAVLEAGGAFLLLDPDLPPERLAWMVQDAEVRRLVAAAPSPPAGPEVAVDLASGPVPEAEPAAAGSAAATTPESLAYLIYTSGSTGRPKGVAVAHGNLAAFVDFAAGVHAPGVGSRMLHDAALSFDATVVQVMSPLVAGARLVLAPHGGVREPRELAAFMTRHRVTSYLGVPSFLQVLVAEPAFAAVDSLTDLTSGGEALSGELARRLMAVPGRRVVNSYGPTEITVYCAQATPGQMAGAGEPPLGRPIANVHLRLVDRHLEPALPGAPGELAVGGATVSRGYLRRPALTAGCFVPDPWSEEAGARLYLTGDRVRRRADGSLEFLGRFDHQVKVRGIRVEPGEIEAVLRRHPAVAEAVVTVPVTAPDDGDGHRRLVAYVVGREGEAAVPGAEDLRAHLRRRLPESMLPSIFVPLDALPLSPQGKLDRRALPQPELAGSGDRQAPESGVEKRLAEIWQGVLGVEAVGPGDNFFSLGGDSILSIQMIARAREAGIELEPAEVFQLQTLGEMAAAARTQAVSPRAEQGAVTGPVPLTPVQRWFFAGDPAAPHHFNMALMLEVPPELEPGRVEQALRRLVEHHDALRLAFEDGPGSWRQVNRGLEVLAGGPPLLSVLDLSATSEAERLREMESAAEALQGSFDLARPPLLRAALFRFPAGEADRLLLLAHHLVVDEISWRLLLEDLERIYQQLEAGREPALPAKTTSFKEWAERLVEHARSGALDGEAESWLRPFEGEPVTVELPVDFPGVEDLEADLDRVTVYLEPGVTDGLLRRQGAERAGGLAVEARLLAALARVLGRWTGAERMLIDTEGHGRESLFAGVDLSRTVGWLTSIYPLVLEAPAGADRGAVLAAVQERLAALPNRGIGYGLLRWLGEGETARRLAALPEPQLSFNYLGLLPSSSAGGPFRLARESYGRTRGVANRRRHRLAIDAVVAGDRLSVTWSYSGRLYRRETVERLAGWLREELEELVTAEAAAGPDEGDFGWSPDELEGFRGAIGDALGEE